MTLLTLKKLVATAAALLLTAAAVAQTPAVGRSWKTVATGMPEAWYGTAEAVAIAENVLLYQRNTGGWYKNTAMQMPLSIEQKSRVIRDKTNRDDSTFDNDATTTEMTFLARVFNKTGDVRYRDAFLEGLDYILEAQYDNGGWPQYYPVRYGYPYCSYITYNDNMMVNVMTLLRGIFERDPLYVFAATPDVVRQARVAFDRGVDCILKTQVIVDGHPTVWCAQHDKDTLKPAGGRAFELPSLTGSESAGVMLLLMSLPDPSDEVRQAIEGAAAWFNTHKIEGMKIETFQNEQGQPDRRIVPAPGAPWLWARFYDLETGEPFFCNSLGQRKESLAEINYERRNGYAWYGEWGQAALDEYRRWAKLYPKESL